MATKTDKSALKQAEHSPSFFTVIMPGDEIETLLTLGIDNRGDMVLSSSSYENTSMERLVAISYVTHMIVKTGISFTYDYNSKKERVYLTENIRSRKSSFITGNGQLQSDFNAQLQLLDTEELGLLDQSASKAISVSNSAAKVV